MCLNVLGSLSVVLQYLSIWVLLTCFGVLYMLDIGTGFRQLLLWIKVVKAHTGGQGHFGQDLLGKS